MNLPVVDNWADRAVPKKRPRSAPPRRPLVARKLRRRFHDEDLTLSFETFADKERPDLSYDPASTFYDTYDTFLDTLVNIRDFGAPFIDPGIAIDRIPGPKPGGRLHPGEPVYKIDASGKKMVLRNTFWTAVEKKGFFPG